MTGFFFSSCDHGCSEASIIRTIKREINMICQTFLHVCIANSLVTLRLLRAPGLVRADDHRMAFTLLDFLFGYMGLTQISQFLWIPFTSAIILKIATLNNLQIFLASTF